MNLTLEHCTTTRWSNVNALVFRNVLFSTDGPVVPVCKSVTTESNPGVRLVSGEGKTHPRDSDFREGAGHTSAGKGPNATYRVLGL